MNKISIKILSVGALATCTITGLVVGTQIVASRYGLHPALGEPLATIGALKFYSPFKLFTWGKVVGTSSGALKAGYIPGACGVVLGFFAALSIRFYGDKLGSRLTANVFGDAAFAKLKEIKEMDLLGKARGVFLGKTEDGHYLRHDGPEHYAIIAPTRSGKGTGIVVPTLLTWRGSCIVYDLKEENYKRTAGQRSKFSDVIYFNPNTLDTHRFNPLFEIRQGILEVRDAQNLASMIIEPDRPGLRDHWVRTGNSLLTAAILHVLYTAPPGEKNLAGVTSLLSKADQNLNETLNEMICTLHLRDKEGRPVRPHPGVVAAARDVLNKSTDDKSSVASTIMGYLDLYRDPLLANATRTSDFTIDSLVNSERPKSLYLVIPAADIDRLRPIIRIMVNFICRRLTEQPVSGKLKDQEHKHKLLLMLDEFTKLGRLEFFENALGFLAGYGIKAMLVTQTLSDLKQTYGERTTLLDNTHVRVFYRPEMIETAEYISKNLGQTTVEYKTRGESGIKGSPFFSNVNESIHLSARPLLTPREILELPDDEALIFVGGRKPIRAKKVVYFQDGSFLPMLFDANRPKRDEVRAVPSVWTEQRFGPPQDFSEEDETFEVAADGQDELVITGEVGKLEHPNKKDINKDISPSSKDGDGEKDEDDEKEEDDLA